MKLTHKQLNDLFLQLDQQEKLFNIEMDGWLAWPVVKGKLWHFLLKAQGDRPVQKLILWKRLRLAVIGIIELIRCVFNRKHYQHVYLYSPRVVFDQANKPFHPMLGALVEGEQFRHACKISYSWGEQVEKFFVSDTIHDQYLGNFLLLLAMLVNKRRRFEIVAAQLVNIIQSVLPECHLATLTRFCRMNLALFWVKRHFYRWFFTKRLLPQAHVYIQDPDGKPGEVAALKSLGAKIIEVQHGVFGRFDVDYAWQENHRSYQPKMTVPEQIYVYGDFWKQLLVSNQFWLESDIIIMPYPVVQRLGLSSVSCKPDSPIMKILFASQRYMQHEAHFLLDQLLSLQKKNNLLLFEIWIKPHPHEANALDCFSQLVEKYPGHCFILPADSNPYSAITRADVVVGYTTMMLIEAICFSKLAIALRSGSGREGFCEAFGFNDLSNILLEANDHVDLFVLLKKLHADRFLHRGYIKKIKHMQTMLAGGDSCQES